LVFEAIAHRGLHDVVPENTLPAFSRALEAGADAVELDVYGTRDGVVVVHHDDRTAGIPSDGSLRDRPIVDLTYREVQSFYLGGGARIPTLTDALEALQGRAIAYVEVKVAGIEEAVAEAIASSGAECAVHSFIHPVIARFAEIAPDIPRGLLQVSRVVDPAALLASAQARDLWQQADLLDPLLVSQVHGAGCRIIAWTANEPVKWARFRSMGVDGICTDNVDRLVEWRGDG
jgi:glycerophosphoryl diester phosphodiesterase